MKTFLVTGVLVAGCGGDDGDRVPASTRLTDLTDAQAQAECSGM